ncbi:MAG: hypothetical protein IKR13_00560 [Victivallales bacterium]|nr:hypothetical protein [Victivallales bacterium]
MEESRNIFVLNLLLCVTIVAVLAVALARRQSWTPSQQLQENTPTPEALPDITLMQSSSEPEYGVAVMDEETAALRDEIAELKAKIAEEDSRRKEFEESNQQKFQEFMAKARKLQIEQMNSSPPLSLTFDELVEKREEFPDIYERIAEQILLDAQERIEARQVLRDCLSNAELDEQQRIKVLAYLDELDEFDRNLSIQNFHPEELPNNLEIFVLLREKAFANQPKITLENLTGAILNPMFFAFKKMEDAR